MSCQRDEPIRWIMTEFQSTRSTIYEMTCNHMVDPNLSTGIRAIDCINEKINKRHDMVNVYR